MGCTGEPHSVAATAGAVAKILLGPHGEVSSIQSVKELFHRMCGLPIEDISDSHPENKYHALRITCGEKIEVPNISRIIDNVGDFNFQYFQDLDN